MKLLKVANKTHCTQRRKDKIGEDFFSEIVQIKDSGMAFLCAKRKKCNIEFYIQ